jgi:acyl-CoA thioester hydrolase
MAQGCYRCGSILWFRPLSAGAYLCRYNYLSNPARSTINPTDKEAIVSELAITYRGVVYPWQCDHMGHMNVMWYVGKFDEATWQLFASVGLTRSALQRLDRGMAGVQQNIAYKCELHPGDTITVRSGLLEMREKAIRFFHEMTNDETGELAAVTVLTAVHIDLQSRKAQPFPAEVLARGRELVIEYNPAV